MNYFIVDETDKRFVIRYPTLDGLPFSCPSGSYNILKARLFNISYTDYLKMARSLYGAKLKGKTGYITEYFTTETNAKAMCKELNARLNKALKEVITKS